VTGSDGGYGSNSYFTGTNVPTDSVSWYEAAQFVNWLNTNTGHQAAYKFTGTQGTSNYTLTTWSPAEADGTNLYRNKAAFYYLPTEDEWVKAAYWNGTTLQTHATKASESLTQGHGSGTGWNYWDNGYATNPSGPWSVVSGSEELNGTYDMMGNAWEWMEGPWTSGDYSASSSRGLRGGGWSGASGDLAASFRGSNDPTLEYYSIGFRVASVPEPGSLAMLAGIALTALLYWWRKRVSPLSLLSGGSEMFCKAIAKCLLVVAVLAIVSPQTSMAQRFDFDSNNYWAGALSWRAGNQPDVDEVTGDMPAPIGGTLLKKGSRTVYGQTPTYLILLRSEGSSGQATITTTGTDDDPLPPPLYYQRSGASAQLYFGIGLAEATNLEFHYSTSDGNSGSGGSIWSGSYPAGPPSNIPIFLYSSSVNGWLSSTVTLVWGPAGDVPGHRPLNPLRESIRKAYEELPEVPGGTKGKRGAVTVAPINAGYGLTEPIYFGETPASGSTPPELAATGYGFISDGPNITSIVLPEALPNGDSQFELLVGDTSYSVSAGSVFDFTSLTPDGVAGFALMGIDPAEGFDPTAGLPFAVGLQFASEGVTQLYTLTYSPVPEPSTFVLLGIGAMSLLGYAWRRRKRMARVSKPNQTARQTGHPRGWPVLFGAATKGCTPLSRRMIHRASLLLEIARNHP
jgi:formylglycine-generating enzyme required for sulfatase activity